MIGNNPDNPFEPNTTLISNVNDTITSLASQKEVKVSAFESGAIIQKQTYLRSEFAEAQDLIIEKSYTDRNGGTLKEGDIIDVKLTITNTGSKAKNNIAYLDSNESALFSS